jgi:hypothetical protein
MAMNRFLVKGNRIENTKKIALDLFGYSSYRGKRGRFNQYTVLKQLRSRGGQDE